MKKILQICLIALLVFVLMQTFVGGALTAFSHSHPVAASQASFTGKTATEGVQMAACLVSIKGVPGIKPTVGWNS